MSESLFKYIEYLLPEYNCVTIPEFGSFIANVEPAQSMSGGAYKAPSYKVIFNPEIKHNDGLLASYIHKSENIAYNVAQTKIKDAVKNIRIELNQHHELKCGRIGTITLSENNSVLFAPNKDNINPYYYGLNSINLLRLQELEDMNLKVRPTSRIKYIYGTVAAAAAVLFFFAMPGTNIQDKGNSNNFQQAGFVSSLTLNSMPKVEETAPTIDESVVVPTANTHENAAVEVAQEVAHPYYIIVGGDTSLKRANQFLERVKKSDFPNASIVESSNRYRIYIATFADKLEGEIYLEKFRLQNPDYETAWLYTHHQ